MEIIGYGLFCLVCSLLEYGLSGSWDRIHSNLFTFFFRGAFQKFFSGCSNTLTCLVRSRKEETQLWENICEYVNQLTSSERSEMLDYLQKVMGKASKKQREEKAPDYSAMFLDRNFFDMSEEKQHKILKDKMKALFGDAKQEVDKEIEFKGVEELINRLFGTECGNPPEAVRGIIGIINDQIYMLKYLHLGSTERDVVKVIQYMIDDSQQKLLKHLRADLDIIIQQNAYYGGQGSAGTDDSGSNPSPINISKYAQRDPFCFVRLECPVCHAKGGDSRGSFVIRKSGDKAFCGRCKNEYEIIRNVDEDEIKTLITGTTNKLQAGLSNLSMEQTEHRKLLESMAQKIVCMEYFDAKVEELKAAERIAESGIQAVRTDVQKIQDMVERKLEETVEQIHKVVMRDCPLGQAPLNQQALEKVIRGLDMEATVRWMKIDKTTEEILLYVRQIAEKLKGEDEYTVQVRNTILDNLSDIQYENRGAHSDIKEEINKLSDKLSEEKDLLSELFSRLTDVKQINANLQDTEDAYCPYCDRTTSFLKVLSSGQKKECTECGYFVDHRGALPKEAKDVVHVVLERKDGNPFFFLPDREKNNTERELPVCCIRMSDSYVSPKSNGRFSDSPGLSCYNPTIVILTSGGARIVSQRDIEMIHLEFPSVSHIFCANNVSLGEVSSTCRFAIHKRNNKLTNLSFEQQRGKR